MPFARINGVVALVENGGSERTMVSQGRLGRGVAGNLVDGRRDARRRFSLVLSHLPHEEARSLAMLAIGYAHVFSFNGAINASTSLGPTLIGHGAHLDIGGGWDGNALVVRSGLSIAFDAQAADEWTVFLRFKGGSGDWRMAAITHDGREWLDGVEGVVGVANIVSVSGGVVTLSGQTIGGSPAALIADELVVLPWRMADRHIVDVLAWEQPWGPAPEVHLVGDVVEPPLGVFAVGSADSARLLSRGSGRAMRGAFTGGSPRSPFTIDDEFINNAMAEEIELLETTRPGGNELLPLPLIYLTHDRNHDQGGTLIELISGPSFTQPGGSQPFVPGPSGALDAATAYSGTLNDRAFRAGSSGSAVGSAGKLSVSGWIRPTSAVSQVLWSKWTEPTGGREWRVSMTAAGLVSVEFSDGGGANRELYETVAAAVGVGSWHHVAFDYDAARAAGSRARIVVDGIPRAVSFTPTGAFTGMTVSTGTLHAVGQSNPTTGLIGQVAHFGLWSASLRTEQHRIAYLVTKRGGLLRRS